VLAAGPSSPVLDVSGPVVWPPLGLNISASASQRPRRELGESGRRSLSSVRSAQNAGTETTDSVLGPRLDGTLGDAWTFAGWSARRMFRRPLSILGWSCH
jgi:hypothetical protein